MRNRGGCTSCKLHQDYGAKPQPNSQCCTPLKSAHWPAAGTSACGTYCPCVTVQAGTQPVPRRPSTYAANVQPQVQYFRGGAGMLGAYRPLRRRAVNKRIPRTPCCCCWAACPPCMPNLQVTSNTGSACICVKGPPHPPPSRSTRAFHCHPVCQTSATSNDTSATRYTPFTPEAEIYLLTEALLLRSFMAAQAKFIRCTVSRPSAPGPSPRQSLHHLPRTVPMNPLPHRRTARSEYGRTPLPIISI